MAMVWGNGSLRQGGGSKLQLPPAHGDLPARGWGRTLCSAGTSCVIGFSRSLKIRGLFFLMLGPLHSSSICRCVGWRASTRYFGPWR